MLQQDSITASAVPQTPALEAPATVETAARTDAPAAAEKASEPVRAPEPEATVADADADAAQADTAEVFVVPDSAFYMYPAPRLTATVAEPPAPPAWHDGLLPVERPVHTASSPGFVTIIVLLMLGLCLSFNTIQRIWGTLIKRLWTTRLRDDYDQITVTERRTVGLLLIVTVFFIAMVSTAGLAYFAPGRFTFDIDTTMRLAGIVTAYFAFQYAVYGTLGYTFATPDGRRVWIEGFTASMSLLGLVLLLPGIVVLFYPDLTFFAVGLSILFYFLARIMFICKGFRIFYTNFGSIVYFILYLCSLEIIPLTILYYFACAWCSR